MNPTSRLLSLAAVCACSLSLLADFAAAQGGGGNQPGAGGQPPAGGGRGGNNGGQRGGGGPGGGGGMFGGGGRAAFDPSVTTEELNQYGDLLKLTKSQKEAAKSLYDAYTAGFTTAAQKARDQMDAIREEARDDPSRWQDLGDVTTKFRAERSKMETGFFSDLKATLTPEQMNIWPSVERTRRRETTMNRGLMSGERVDLVKIVDGLKLSADARKPIDPVLEQYTVDLDRELIVRNEAQDKMQGNFRDLISGDQAKAQKMLEDGRAASTKLRDVNKRYVRQVENALPDDATKAKFNEEIRKESFPLIYRASNASRTVDAAAALKDLKPEQKTSIAEIKDRFTRDLAALNKKMETAYEQRESTITIAELMGRFGGGGQGGGGGGGRGQGGGGFGMIDSEELTTLRDQRRELETTTVEKIQGLLTEDQKAEMPSQRGGGRGGNGGGGNGGGGDNAAPRGNRNRPNNNQPTPPSGRT